MSPELIERVMNCRDLPTLPAVAMRVVELTSSDRVSIRDLSETIQNDQALAAKVLRTVNSSLFGLRTRCANINQAIVMLGMSTVKTLALGFSLVGAIKDKARPGFDIEDHWRRALYTGISARLIASRAGAPDPEEAFLGALLQDVGMIALSQALGKDYLDILARAEGDHRSVTKFELDSLQTQHADIGAMLARRWKLPEQLVMPIKYHERASAAPVEHSVLCRAVGLGNLASDVLTSAEPAAHLRKFYQRAEQWFAMRPLEADELFKVISTQAREVATLLSVPVGKTPDIARVMEEARSALGAFVPASAHSTDPSGGSDITPGTDELTGVADRMRLEQLLVAAFEQAVQGVAPLSMCIAEILGVEEIAHHHGADALDTILISSASRLERVFAQPGGIVARYDDRSFAVLLPKTDRSGAMRLCEQAKRSLTLEPIKLIAANPGSPPELTPGVSIGMASVDQRSARQFESALQFTRVVEQATAAARKAGLNSVRVYVPQAA